MTIEFCNVRRSCQIAMVHQGPVTVAYVQRPVPYTLAFFPKPESGSNPGKTCEWRIKFLPVLKQRHLMVLQKKEGVVIQDVKAERFYKVGSVTQESHSGCPK